MPPGVWLHNSVDIFVISSITDIVISRQYGWKLSSWFSCLTYFLRVSLSQKRVLGILLEYPVIYSLSIFIYYLKSYLPMEVSKATNSKGGIEYGRPRKKREPSGIEKNRRVILTVNNITFSLLNIKVGWKALSRKRVPQKKSPRKETLSIEDRVTSSKFNWWDISANWLLNYYHWVIGFIIDYYFYIQKNSKCHSVKSVN